MLRTMLLLTGGLFLTVGFLAAAWSLLTMLQPGWRAAAALTTPAVGLAGVALLASALLVMRYAARVGRPGDPAHAIDASADAPRE